MRGGGPTRSQSNQRVFLRAQPHVPAVWRFIRPLLRVRGPQLAADAENAVYVLRREYDIDASGHHPRAVRSLIFSDYHSVVALDKAVARALRVLGLGTDSIEVWNVRDPWGHDLSEYVTCSIAIKSKLVGLKRRLEERANS